MFYTKHIYFLLCVRSTNCICTCKIFHSLILLQFCSSIVVHIEGLIFSCFYYNICPSSFDKIVTNKIYFLSLVTIDVATPLWDKCEDETHTPKSGKLESSGTPENSELKFKGQNTSHWSVIYSNGKVLKCRCPKWPRMCHLDIYNPSYGQKKGRESNWQFDSRPLKVMNRSLPDIC